MTEKEARSRAERLAARMTPEERASRLQIDTPAVRRLRLPACGWQNALLPEPKRGGSATVFPRSIGLGAAFDPQLVKRIGECAATEARAKTNAARKYSKGGTGGGLVLRTPDVNILRDPRQSGGQDAFGEDPALTGKLGAEYVKGLQGDGLTMRAAACVGRLALPTGPEGDVSQKDLAETYLPPFETMVREAKPEAILASTELSNGSGPALLRLLREKWGFDGVLIADNGEPSQGQRGKEDVSKLLNAGFDLGCGTVEQIVSACERGLVPEERTEKAAARCLAVQYRLGLFGKTGYDRIPYAEVESPEHLDLARTAALESAVLLKNDGVLPLEREKLRTLGVIGPCADSRWALTGGKSDTAYRYITVQEGLQDYLYGSGIRVMNSDGRDLTGAAAVAEMSDAVILVLGTEEDPADGPDTMELSENQRELMETAARAGKPTVLVLLTGGWVDLRYATEHFGAILHMWRSGSMGGRAAAELLFGDVSPSGKLPVTLYRSLRDLPALEDCSMKGRTYKYVKKPVLYPFGFGLTYGNVIIRSARLKNRGEDGWVFEADIGNRGPRSTGEVLQVYVRRLDSPLAPPHPALCAFKRVWLPVWGHTTVEIPIPESAFTVTDREGRRVAGGRFELYLGTSQPDELSRALTGKTALRVEVGVSNPFPADLPEESLLFSSLK